MAYVTAVELNPGGKTITLRIPRAEFMAILDALKSDSQAVKDWLKARPKKFMPYKNLD